VAVFYSFHYERDVFRVQQILNMGQFDGQKILNPQDWEAVKARGDEAVENWTEEQMRYKQAVVILIGRMTADRRWVRYEITKAWNDSRPLVGIRIHGLRDPKTGVDTPGPNPFAAITFTDGSGSLADFVPVHDPGSDVYRSIQANLARWVAGAYKRS
jgi:hypothetical protein